jgi:GGDEF domain-containing protein
MSRRVTHSALTSHLPSGSPSGIADALRTPVRVADRDPVVSASIGIALSTPQQSRPDTLLRKADTALYQANTAGKATHLEG